MKSLSSLTLILFAALSTGCAVATVASTAVSVVGTVVETGVSVAGKVVEGTVDLVTPSKKKE